MAIVSKEVMDSSLETSQPKTHGSLYKPATTQSLPLSSLSSTSLNNAPPVPPTSTVSPPLPPSILTVHPPLPPGPPPPSDNNGTHIPCKSVQSLYAPPSFQQIRVQQTFNAPSSHVSSFQSNYDAPGSHVGGPSLEICFQSHTNQEPQVDLSFPPPPHSHGSVYQSFPICGFTSVPAMPPPLFTVPPTSFNFPPPMLTQPPPAFKAHSECGIPFPPPGYQAVNGCEQTITLEKAQRTSEKRLKSRSKSPLKAKLKSTCRSEQSRRRSRSTSHGRRSNSRSGRRRISGQVRQRSRSPSRRSRSRRRRSRSRSRRSRSRSRRSRSHSRRYRSRNRQTHSRSRRSTSHSHSKKHSRLGASPIKRRSRSRSRCAIQSINRKRRSRSKSPTRRHSRSPSRAGSRWSRSSNRTSRRSRSTCKSVRHEKNNLKGSEIEGKVGEHSDSIRDKTIDGLSAAKPKLENTVESNRKDSELISAASCDKQLKSDRESLVERWRLNNCKSLEEMTDKLDILSKMEADEIIELEKQTWTRSAPADLYYKRHSQNVNLMEATPKLLELCEQFELELIHRAERIREGFPTYSPLPRRDKLRVCKHEKTSESSSNTSCEDSSSDDEEDKAMMELERKRKHPQRLHPELWHNEQGEMNDGPLCRCSQRARRSGIRHNVYVGEQQLKKCDVITNNAGKLFHYRVTMSPPVNFLTKTPTIIEHDSHEYIFEGFSMFSHFPLVKLPTCKVIRFNIEYTILYVDESMPENFTIRELDLFYRFLFHEILELLDLDLRAFGDPSGCNQFHFMPRFVRDLPENGKEILSMNEVLKYLIKSNKPLIPEDRLNEIYNMSLYDWQTFADEVKCMVVTNPGMKPCSLRVDQLDRDTMDEGRYPEIVHFGIRPPQLSYAGNPEYQRAWREYVKFRHLLANMPKPSAEDKRKLMGKENRLQEMRTLSKMKRDVTIALSSKGFYRTGIMCDIIQHAMLLPVLVCHLRFHRSLDQLENDMDYKFQNRYLLQLALTHPSYRENFGTNPDHARNSLTNCGIRQPEYGDRRIHYMNTRKRGINTLIQIMSRFGKKEATESNIGHNERLEFLGDAVVEFITSIHLFHLFPDLEEGGLATYRAAIVQNQHLAVMAQRLNLDAYMLYAHGSDLCHDLELRHAMANCFEALMGALFLDGGIEVADKVFGHTLWQEESRLTDVWMNYPLHPLQEQEPAGDRQWIQHFPVLQKLTEFEERSGIAFKHIRLLARAFTDRSVGYTNLTLGSNQRLEFLGDTVLQIIASEYLYKFFPEHHEGHLSLLRSSLVNNRTQAVVCDDLGMTSYAIYANPKHDIKTKDRADLLEAFLGALYIDKGLKHCHVFCEVCFFPRLQDFIMNQDWNDPKSKLQQCCLTLRTMEGGEPDIPVYKVIECMGPTNTRVYTVAVYFRGQRLAQASGHSIQQAEMNAANQALSMSTELFPQLDHQRRVIAKSMKKQRKRAKREAALKAAREVRDLEMKEAESRSRSRREDRHAVSRSRNHERRGDRHRESSRDRHCNSDRYFRRVRGRDSSKDRDKRSRDKDYKRRRGAGDRDHKSRTSREKEKNTKERQPDCNDSTLHRSSRDDHRNQIKVAVQDDWTKLCLNLNEDKLKREGWAGDQSECDNSDDGSLSGAEWVQRSRSGSYSSSSGKNQPEGSISSHDSSQLCSRDGPSVCPSNGDGVPGTSALRKHKNTLAKVDLQSKDEAVERMFRDLKKQNQIAEIEGCTSEENESECEMPNSTDYIWDRLRDYQATQCVSSSSNSVISDGNCSDFEERNLTKVSDENEGAAS